MKSHWFEFQNLQESRNFEFRNNLFDSVFVPGFSTPLIGITLTNDLDYDSIRANQSIPNHSEVTFWTNTNEGFNFRLMQIGWKAIRLNRIQSEVSIRMNPRSELFELKIGFDQSKLGLIRIYSDWIGLSRIDFWPFFIKRDTKRFSDWFEMIRISSDTNIEINRNSYDLLGLNSNQKILPGKLTLKMNPFLCPAATVFFWILSDSIKYISVANFLIAFNPSLFCFYLMSLE